MPEEFPFLPQLCECSPWLHLFSAPVLLGFAQTSRAHGIPALPGSARDKENTPQMQEMPKTGICVSRGQ